MQIKIFTLIFTIFSFSTASAEMWLDEWLKLNVPKVKTYLSTLDASNKQKAIDGVVLSDQSNPLQGLTFIHYHYIKNSKTHVYVFEKNDKNNIAYIWSEQQEQQFPLPQCNDHPKKHFPGWEAAALSGDVYTYKTIQSTNDLVITHCVPKEWL